jgi:CarboxypepD_reg-like domain
MLMIRAVFTLFFLFVYKISLSQEISGVVIAGKTNQPLEGASVYFNNTTIGTTTNYNGEFILEYKKAIKTPLIVSFLGYETVILHNFSTSSKLKIYLNEATNVLNEVILSSKDDWPRKLKLKEFRKNFLGESENGLASKILNEEDIALSYNKSEKQLLAWSNVPIIIKNNHLKYLITVDLQSFEVNYSYVSKNKKHVKVRYVYYSGRNFYKSMQDFPSKSTIDKRLDTYFGSTLHFMRSLASQNLENEHFKLYIGNIPYKVEKFISVSPIDSTGGVTVILKDKFSVIYNSKKRSYIEYKTPKFYIDNFGNHSPPEVIRFGGDFGRQRMGDTLPLDFLLTSKSAKKTN